MRAPWAIGLALLTVLGGCGSNSPESRFRQWCNGSDSAKAMAYVMSQRFVREQAGIPGAAVFPNAPLIISHVGPCIYVLEAGFDTPDTLGAALHSGYKATMMYLPDSDGWVAPSLEILDEPRLP